MSTNASYGSRYATPEQLRQALGRSALTVGDLREALEGYDDEALVVFQADYGDYHHTQQALPITTVEDAEALNAYLYKSAYSRSEVAIGECGDTDDDGEPTPDEPEYPNVVILG